MPAGREAEGAGHLKKLKKVFKMELAAEPSADTLTAPGSQAEAGRS
jgi:hypothetical protein